MLSGLRAALVRIRQHFLGARLAREQDEEFAFHIEMQVEHNKRLGMSDADARRAALMAFGGRERFREETRDARGVVLLDNLGRDVRFALRRLRRAPAFSFGAIATLGIGVGIAAGIGTMVYGVLLRELPYPDSDRLVRVSFLTPGLAGDDDTHSAATYVHFASGTGSFSAMSAHSFGDGFNLTDGDAPEAIIRASVTPNVFSMLGVTPVIGALFASTDTNWYGGTSPILISERLWRRRYGADSSIIGRRIDLNYGSRDVIGVLPHTFDFPDPTVDVWYPVQLRLPASLTQRGFHSIARLQPGVSLDQAQAELNAMIPSIPDRYPRITPQDVERSGARVVLRPLKSTIVAPVRGHLVLLGVMVAVILLIASTNVVNLFLLRAEQARQETAIAISLGAGRVALAQRFIVEGMLIGAASTAIAIPVAAVAIATKFGFGARDVPRLHEIGFGAETVLVIVLGALALGALIGAAALTRAGDGNVGDTLRGARTIGSAGWRRVQRGLVTIQVAFALALLAGAGLLGRSFINLSNAPLGFEPANTLTFGASLPFRAYLDYPQQALFHAQVVDRLRALPGVVGVATVRRLPLTPTGGGPPLRLDRPDFDAEPVAPRGNLASAEYFSVMGIPVRGRTFAPGDLRAATPAVILSEALARTMFGDVDPIGRLVRRPAEAQTAEQTHLVIGVAGNVPEWRIEDGPSPDLYFPLLRDGDGLEERFRIPYEPRDVTYVIRGAAPAPSTLRAILTGLDRNVPAVDIKSLDALVAEATARVRLTLLLLGVAAAAALLLGVVGVYSVVSYAAAGRLREFGVRLALGATSGGVARMVLRDGLTLTVTGIVAGVALALTGARFLRSLLYQVSPTSLPELALAVAVIVVVTLLSTLVPARRAARTDPAVVLRGE